MKPLRSFLDMLEPAFKDGKLKRLYPLFEAIDTLAYSPKEVTRGVCHVRDAMDLKRMMMTVVVALFPCVFMAMYNTGLQANLAMAKMGVGSAPGWHGQVLAWLSFSYDASI